MTYAAHRRIIDVDSHLIELDDFLHNAARPEHEALLPSMHDQKGLPVLQAALDRGWELVAHNYEQGDLLTNYHFDRAAEADLIDRALQVYEQVVGKPARGWLSSSLRSTTQTADILVERGLSFICDYMNDEQPYLIQTPGGPIVSTPYSVEINDFTFFERDH